MSELHEKNVANREKLTMAAVTPPPPRLHNRCVGENMCAQETTRPTMKTEHERHTTAGGEETTPL